MRSYIVSPFKHTGSDIAIEAIAKMKVVLGDGRDEPVHIAVVVVVADGGTHARLVDDYFAIGNPGKCGVTVVDKHLTVLEVCGH